MIHNFKRRVIKKCAKILMARELPNIVRNKVWG
jgi:hypothetical protein